MTSTHLRTMKLSIFLALVAATFLSASSVFAHSGGTDSNGCNAGKQPRHCH